MTDIIDQLERFPDDYASAYETYNLPDPEKFNFTLDIVRIRAQRAPNDLAIMWIGLGGEEKNWTYAELHNEAHRAAIALERIGVRKGDRVLVMLPRIIEWWAISLGILLIGAVLCPSTTLLQAKDLRYRIEVSHATTFIGNLENAKKVEEAGVQLNNRILVHDCYSSKAILRQKWLLWEDVLPSSHGKTPQWQGPTTLSSDPAIIFFTSGTTGMPKMVLHTQVSYPLAHFTTGKYWLKLCPGKVYWNLSEQGWAKAAWSFFGTFLLGATLFIQDIRGPFSPKATLETLVKYPITTLCAAPTAYRPLTSLTSQQYVRKHSSKWKLEWCVGAGEPLNPAVIEQWAQMTGGLTIRDGYGQTETVLVCGNFDGVKIKPGSMGKPTPGIHLAIIDKHGQEVSCGEEGDFAIAITKRSDRMIFKGYLQPDGKLDRRELRSLTGTSWYLTGDRGFKDEDEYLWFKGRDDDVINSSGYRIGPFEVESALKDHPAVLESAVVASPDPKRSEIVKAFIVLSDEYKGRLQELSETKLIKEIQDHVKRISAPYKYPREIEFVDSLPKTVSGKIRRVELRAQERLKKRNILLQNNFTARL